MFCKHLLRMKQFLTFPLFVLLANIAFAQTPSNDNCSGAITLTAITAGGVCPTTVYTNVGASDATGTASSPNPTCFNGLRAFKDVWFKFTTPSVGGNLNYRVTVRGVSTADSIKNPQVAMYIGDCGSGLFQEYCATKLVSQDTNAINLDAGCMRPNTTYFIQVGSFLSTDVGGRFTVCIEPIDPVYIMRPIPQTTTACEGTVYDSGGPNSNYGVSQSGYTFDIRPLTTGCVELTIDSFAMESNYDSLVIFDGRTGTRLDRITGSTNKGPIVLQLRTDWVQLKFYSDGSLTARGFKASWRSLLVCNTPPPTSCATPDLIQRLPFSQQGATTCNDNIDGITSSPCTPASSNTFLEGKDHIYKYTSSGAQCIQVTLTGIPVTSLTGTANLGIYYGCPGTPGATCVKNGILNTTRDSVFARNVTLEAPGDYYFVVSRREACMPFNILIDTIPCLNRLPNAGSCSRALTLNDCSNQNPSDIVLDLSVTGDSTFMYPTATPPSINSGCISGLGGTPPRYNYVFLYFQAKADGKFGFTVSPIGSDPSFDIDFNMYGPMDSLGQICTYTKNNVPIRSSFGVGSSTPNRMQGFADSYTNTLGQVITVTDTCEGTGVALPGLFDGVVRRVDVKQGKYYALWINDYNGSVGRNGVRLNFNGTTDGVLNNTPVEKFEAGRDTIICPGGSAPLFATGGIAYQWKPSAGLSSDTASKITARPTVSTAYNVSIQGTCRIVPKIVNVGVFAVKDVLNQTVCKGEELIFDAGITYPLSSGAVWSWVSTTGHLSELSCNNCPNPTFKATNTTGATETHTFIVSLTTPNCILKDTVIITVTAGQVPNYQVITSKSTRDTSVCIGSTFNLLKTGFDNTATYTWASDPSSTVTDKNPFVAPTSSVKYYVSVTGGTGGCTATSKDSVIITLYQSPILTRALKDTTLCKDEKIQIGKTTVQSNTTYSWSNLVGLSSGTTPNPTVTVAVGKQVYILTATNPGNCVSKDTMTVTGINLAAKIDTVDSIRICRGVPLTLKTATTPTNLKVKWGSNKDFSLPTDSTTSVTVNPTRRTLYYITASMPGCTRRDSAEVYVDSLPSPTNILPQDTTVCMGTLILLRSPVFEPVLFPGITFKWTPTKGTVTSDSLYNIVLSADSTRTYKRLMQNGVCRQIDSTKVNVNPNPVIVLLPRDTILCETAGLSVTLNASSVTPNVKDWKWTGPQGAISAGDGKTTLPVTPSVGVNRYTVTAKVGDCPGSASTTITVRPAPTVTFPADPTICKDNSIVLNTSPNSAFSYSWTGPSSFTSTLGAPSVTPVASGTYFVTVTDNATNCKSTKSVDIAVATATLAVTPNTSICAGLPLTLTATGTTNVGTGTYRWNTGATTAAINPTTTVNGTYTVTYTYGNGKCTTNASTTVTSVPSFGLRISPDTFRNDRLLDQGTPVTLNAVLTGNAPGPTFNWSVNGSSLGTTQTVSIKPLVEGAYKVAVSSTSGCSKDTSIQIFIRYPKYDIPNAFTPNGDTVNSYFGPIFNDRFPPAATDPNPRFWKGRIEVTSFQVFSRWGGEIYTETNTTTLNSATYKGWDGKKGTNDVASDVYVYIIKLRMPDDSIRVETGEINLIR